MGRKHTKETKLKMSLAKKGYLPKSHFKKGHIMSIATRKKISIAKYGKKLSKEHKKKIGLANKGKGRKKGYTHSEETKRKMSASQMGKGGVKGRHPVGEFRKGYKMSEVTRQKIRNANIRYLQNVRYIKYPCIGKNEQHILDNLEKQYNVKIKRQYQVCGYYLDGYSPQLNIVFEVDETHHYKNNVLNTKDVKRQKYIEKELGCTFIRIRGDNYARRN